MSPINRRTFLATTMVAGSAALAGCGGKSSSKKWNAKLNGPDTVAYDSDFSLSVIIKNTGGSESDVRATLTSQKDRLDLNKEISVTVPSGDSKKITTDPITPSTVGEYPFVLRKKTEDTVDAESEGDQQLASTTVTVEPKDVSPKTSVKLNDDLLVTVEDITVAKSVFTSNGGDTPTGVFEAPTGKIFAVYDLTVENVGSQWTPWGPAFVSVYDGKLYDDNVPTLSGHGEELNTKRDIPAAESVSGYLFAQLPTESANDDIPLLAQAGNESAAPEYRWPFGDTPRKFPEFELKNVNAPQEVQDKQPYEIELTVANTGDGAGTVKAILQYTKGLNWENLSSASPSPVITGELPAGEEKTFSVTNTTSSGIVRDKEYTYRATPFETTWTTSVS